VMKYTYEPKNLTLEYMRDNGRRFAEYPECQRDFVWKLTYQRRLIDTALRGFPISPLVIVVRQDELIGAVHLILDGQQRYETFRRYMNDEFATAKRWRDPRVSPMYPGLRYSELPMAARNGLDNYTLRLDCYHDIPDEEIEMMFRRYQYSVPLNLSEKLWSYSGTVKELCRPLLKHRFWKETYGSNVDRKQAYQMLVMAVLMEQMQVYCNQTTQRLKDTVAQQNVSFTVDRSTIDRIERHLDIASDLFNGAIITGMSQFTPVYQAVMLLDRMGCNFTMAEIGVLADWFNNLRLHMLEERRRYHVNPFGRLQKTGDQLEFWLREIPKLRKVPGLVFKDRKRRFTEEQKLTAWVEQDGKCGICGKRLRSQYQGHHIAPHASGGPTSQENCLLVCEACHKGETQSSFV